MPAYSDYNDDSEAPATKPSSGDNGKDEGDYPTAMLPKAMFGDSVNPGDSITLRVEKVDEDNVICCKDDSSGKEEKPESEPEEAPAPSGGMSSMMSDE